MDPGPPPDFVTVKRSLTRVASEYHMVDGLEYSGPIRANAPSSIPWIMCFEAPRPSTTYAAFFKGDEYIRSRMSVIEDRCDSKSYGRFLSDVDPASLAPALSSSGFQVVGIEPRQDS